MGLYQHSDYRKALREILDERKSSDASVSFSSYADAIGVQKTFVSKVLGGSAHLSDDQLYLTFEYLKFDKEEENYFRLLYDHSRTGLHARKKVIHAEIKKIQEEKRQLKIHTTAEVQKPETKEDLSEYYLNPLNLIVHAYLAIDQFSKNPSLIASELELTPQRLSKILDCLKRLKIIDFNKAGSRVEVLKYAMHLDVDSIYCQPHQQLMRMKCAEQIVKLTPERRFISNLTFSGDQALKNLIQEMYLDFMKKVEKAMDDAEGSEEAVYQINFDLFPWSKKD